MAVTQQWATPEAIQTALTTELDALANAAISAASGAINNETGLYQYLEVELVLASLTPTGTPYCLLYINKQIDGANYEDLSVSATHAIACAIPYSTAVAAKRVVITGIPIQPCLFKLAIQNQSGPSLGASGNTLKYRRYNEQAV